MIMIVTRVIIADKMTSAIAIITAAIAQVVNTEPDGPGATTERNMAENNVRLSIIIIYCCMVFRRGIRHLLVYTL